MDSAVRPDLLWSVCHCPVTTFLSKEITGLDLAIGAIFLRKVLAGRIFGARCSEDVDLKISC